MAIEVFNRIEHKYIIDTVTYRKVLEAMAPHMTDITETSGRTPLPIFIMIRRTTT